MAAMHAISHSGAEPIRRGIRPFDVSRDLRPVARLIAEAFADELDEQGEAALRELRLLGHMSGLVRLLSRSTGEFQNVFNGFVWLEEGKLVGNVTVQRAIGSSGRWQIANVAVAPPWRGRGISRALMEQALEYIADMGGAWAVLQVRANNTIARGLYERMGFEEMGGTIELVAPRPPRRIMAPSIPDLVAYSGSDTSRIYDLANTQASAESRWWRSLRRTDFHLPVEQQLSEWLSRVAGRERVYRRAIQKYQSRFEAALELTARRWPGEHRLKIWSRPESRNEHEHSLILWALTTLQDYPIWPVHASLSTDNYAALALLIEYGFEERTTLLTLRRRA